MLCVQVVNLWNYMQIDIGRFFEIIEICEGLIFMDNIYLIIYYFLLIMNFEYQC